MKGGNKSETLLKSQQRLFKLCHTIAIAIQCLAAILFYSRTELNRKVEYLCLEATWPLQCLSEWEVMMREAVSEMCVTIGLFVCLR